MSCKLPHRSIHFKFETLNQNIYYTGTINYPNDYDFTRVTEFKYLTGQKHKKTNVVYEFLKSDGGHYYPIPRPENNELYKRYQALAVQSNILLVVRLATYKYYNMNQVVAQVLSVFKEIKQVNDVNVDRGLIVNVSQDNE
ncbi:UDP-galactopyranose mutase [Mucilaginibacter sp.]|uniref:UDP-galactopyranose mutase n=1 Tax=Mucilaginibacter sp. TaxID=1882438 RepID=UPI003D0E6514